MNTEDSNTLNWIIGILLFVGAMSIISQTKAGYAIIYYALVLILLFLVLTQSPWIAQELSYVTAGIPQDTPSKSSGKTTSAPTMSMFGPAGIIPL